MPAKSESQRRFFGLVRGVQKGQVSKKKVGKKVARAAETMSVKSVRDFAKGRAKDKPKSRPKKGRGGY